MDCLLSKFWYGVFYDRQQSNPFQVEFLLSVSIALGSFLIIKQSVERIASTAAISTEFSLLISVFSIFLNLGGFGLFGKNFLGKSEFPETSSLWTEMVIANTGYVGIMLSVVLSDWKIFDSIVAFGIGVQLY